MNLWRSSSLTPQFKQQSQQPDPFNSNHSMMLWFCDSSRVTYGRLPMTVSRRLLNIYRIETTQSLWATALVLTQWRGISRCSVGTSCVSICSHYLFSCDWAPLTKVCSTSLYPHFRYWYTLKGSNQWQEVLRTLSSVMMAENLRHQTTSHTAGRSMCLYFGKQNICRVIKVDASQNHFDTKPIWQVNCSRFYFALISLYIKCNHIYLCSHKEFLDMSWPWYL